MKPFEFLYLCCEPGLPIMYARIRRILKGIVGAGPSGMRILDIGGRKSHYTIGVPARITISDLPRSNAVQHRLNLGISEQMMSQLQERRSNVEQIIFDDMTASSLPTAAFHCAVAIEVLEHVENDAAFLREVRRVLTPNGVFVMTTPNGDFVANRNPKRHYRRCELIALLSREFKSVDVQYGIPDSRSYRMSLKSWSFRQPLDTMAAAVGGIINSLEERRAQRLGTRAGMRELIAIAHNGS
jgi:ubiquinone/menaquinone biosynthesis C-methylase UbiE